MVTRVIGEVNGDSIIFAMDEEGIWRATIPSTLNGEYIVGLYAYDEAGNSTYMAKMLFAITGHDLTLKMLDKSYVGDFNPFDFAAKLDDSSFTVEQDDKEFSGNVEQDDIKGNYKDTGYIGELLNS